MNALVVFCGIVPDCLGVNIDHDCTLETHAQVTAGVTIAGGCQIKQMAFIGSGATLVPGVIVGKYAQVAAQSLVSKSVEPYTLVAGSPARFVRALVKPS